VKYETGLPILQIITDIAETFLKMCQSDKMKLFPSIIQANIH